MVRVKVVIRSVSEARPVIRVLIGLTIAFGLSVFSLAANASDTGVSSDSSSLRTLNEEEMSSVNAGEGFQFEFEAKEFEIGALRLEDSDNFGEITLTDVLINRYGETSFTLDVDGSDGVVIDFPETTGLTLDIGTNDILLGSTDPGPSLATFGVDLAGTTLNVSSH